MPRIYAIVGMPGSGKSTAVDVFRENGFEVVRFGDITDEYLKREGKEITEENEKKMRLKLREEHGMEAYAVLNYEKIKRLIKKNKKIVIDGLRSYSEYLFLKEKFKDDLIIIGIHTPQKLRIERLKKRKERPLTKEEVISRDFDEIVNLHIGGTFAMSDIMINGDCSKKELKEKILSIIN